MIATAEIDHAERELLDLLEQEDREKVAPVLERFRDVSINGSCSPDIRFKGVRGGRGAGAKSWSLVSLLVQESQYYPHRVACLREVQLTLEESVYELVEKTVERLQYPGWHFTKSVVESPAGAHWIFKGLRDLRATRNIKGLEGFTRFLVEEASALSSDSWEYMLPTLFRNAGAQLHFGYNPETDYDPVTTSIWIPYQNDPSAMLIECRPEGLDNPWWSEGLQALSDKLKVTDPDLWEHVYGGKPRSQGVNAILARVQVRMAMDRKLQDPEGAIEVGCDPADMGDDKTEIYKRKGFKIIDHRELRRKNGTQIANEIWTMIDHDPSIPVKVDITGIGTSTRDNLRRLGAKVVAIHFGGKAKRKDRYPNTISEMWFNFGDVLEHADLPDDAELMSDLSSRLYEYDAKGRRVVESKKEFKKRYGRSPDKGDAILLCYYTGANINMSDETRKGLAKRYQT